MDNNAMFTREGFDLVTVFVKNWKRKECLRSTQLLHDEIIGMNIFNSVFVDCTASAEVASLYKDLLNIIFLW